MAKYIALTIGEEPTLDLIELSDQETKQLQAGELGFLDFDCQFIFMDEGAWENFKTEVEQF